MIGSLSWRNIRRNKTRSGVVLGAIALGLCAGVFSVAFMTGWMNQRVNTVIQTEVSHIQLHHPDYLATTELSDHIPHTRKKLKHIQRTEGVRAASSRIISNGMIATAEANTGVQLLGIQPDQEKQVTNIHQKVREGSYFQQDIRNPIVIGRKLAKKLNARLQSKVVITLQEADGTITGGAFRVTGIYETANTNYEARKAFVKKEDLRRLTNLSPSLSHEIAVLLKSEASEDRVADILAKRFPQTEVLTWKELMPDIKLMNENMDLMMYIFIGIILLALMFGIINTMLMVIMERVKELGMLMAIGMNKIRVFLMIILETVYLCLTGGITGIAIGTGITLVTGYTGINLNAWSEGLNAYGFESFVYPQIGIEQILEISAMVIIVGIIAALYPAWKAIQLKPAEALHMEN